MFDPTKMLRFHRINNRPLVLAVVVQVAEYRNDSYNRKCDN